MNYNDRAVVDVLRCFDLSPAELGAVRRDIEVELMRHIATIGPRIAIRCLLPAIQRQTTQHFMRYLSDANVVDELSSNVALKILRHVDQKGIRGNAAALVAKTRRNVLRDHFRAVKRRAARFEAVPDLALIEDAVNSDAEGDGVDSILSKLPSHLRAIAKLTLEGRRFADVAKQFGMTPKEARSAIQRAWPGGLSFPKNHRSMR